MSISTKAERKSLLACMLEAYHFEMKCPQEEKSWRPGSFANRLGVSNRFEICCYGVVFCRNMRENQQKKATSNFCRSSLEPGALNEKRSQV